MFCEHMANNCLFRFQPYWNINIPKQRLCFKIFFAFWLNQVTVVKNQKIETILDSSEIFTFQSSITALALLNFFINYLLQFLYILR